jgi:hypothetical protein
MYDIILGSLAVVCMLIEVHSISAFWERIPVTDTLLKGVGQFAAVSVSLNIS